MKKWKRLVIAGIVVFGVLLVVPFLIPMSAYTQQAEQIASEQLGVPVKLESMRLAILPTPRVNVSGIVIGKDEEVRVKEVAVVPALSSLFSAAKMLSSVRLDEPVIKKGALDILDALTKGETKGPSPVIVQEIEVNNGRVEWPEMKLPEFDAQVTMRPDNRPNAALIETTDGKLKLKLTPQGETQSINLTARDWTVPYGAPLHVDTLASDMVLKGNTLEITQLDAGLYQGKVNGTAKLDWTKDWQLNGKLKIENMSVKEPVQLMSKATRVSGRLFSDGTFSAKSSEPAKLPEHLIANFNFDVKNGVLYGMDLTKAASLLLRQGQKGGETQFDEFSGIVQAKGKLYNFKDLKISSGLMSASGNVKLMPDKHLDGVATVNIKNSATLAEIPLQVSGTVQDPVVMPTKAALAGAAAGAAVGGPLGAGLGIKAAEGVEKLKGLFGGEDK
ncbi:MAG TPA: AsmA family protein [Methylophilaceae bacterium]|nr:AsmA family protein [Methylophilaceae bacterium]